MSNASYQVLYTRYQVLDYKYLVLYSRMEVVIEVLVV